MIDQAPPLLAGLAAEAIRVEAKKVHRRFCEIVGSEPFTQEAQAKAQAEARAAT